MDEKTDIEKAEDVLMLPGFRFHPTDEELVGFYLKRKIQQRPLSIELIKQVDIYKYDPWDLPKLAASGEKEWYFYCPRDRKYRNSARPNRVTGAGFWKATGTDRPIYSSDGTKCIGLKKSLVFYRGRAAKGMKTDWMMHEFRLPSLPDSASPKKAMDKSLPANDSWAICRIFKKANSMSQRGLSHSWVYRFPGTTTTPDVITQGLQSTTTQFSPDNISCITEIGSAIQFPRNTASLSVLEDNPSFKELDSTVYKPPIISCCSTVDFPNGFMFSPFEVSEPTKCSVGNTSMVFNQSLIDSHRPHESANFEGQPENFSSFSISFSEETQGNANMGGDKGDLKKNPGENQADNQWETTRTIGFPFPLPSSDTWKPTHLPWESPSCPTEISHVYTTDKRGT